MKLIILFGPPAVGKMTIGKILEERTGFRLFHNHMVMDGVMHIFGYNTPSENRLSRLIRSEIIGEAARANIDLIFTYVWDFSSPRGKQNIDRYKEIYESYGGEVQFIELQAPVEVRASRADNENRLRSKPNTANSDDVMLLETKKSFSSPKPFYYPDYVQLDATKPAEDVAETIIDLL